MAPAIRAPVLPQRRLHWLHHLLVTQGLSHRRVFLAQRLDRFVRHADHLACVVNLDLGRIFWACEPQQRSNRPLFLLR